MSRAQVRMWVRVLFNHVEQVEHVEIFNAEYLTQSSREAEKQRVIGAYGSQHSNLAPRHHQNHIPHFLSHPTPLMLKPHPHVDMMFKDIRRFGT